MGTNTVILLGCVSRKQSTAAPAQDLYDSPLWHRRRGYAEHRRRAWFIVSAEHGLLLPDDVVEPYDTAMSDLDARTRRGWGVRVVEQLRRRIGSLDGVSIEVHAGQLYRDALEAPALDAGATLVNPVAGLGIGQQLAWYDRQ